MDNLSIKKNDDEIEITLRAKSFSDLIGRDDLKRKIRVLIDAATSRGDVLEHILFYGPPGLGKTSFAYAIASEMKSNIVVTSGPALATKADVISIFSNVNRGDIVFIDEIHRLSRVLEEFIYPILEDFVMDFTLGKGALAKVIRIDVPKFTLIGATTQIGLIKGPLRDRFGVVFKVDFMDIKDLTKVVLHVAKKMNLKIDQEAALEIAKRSRGTARIAIKYLKRCRDYAQAIFKSDHISIDHVESTFEDLEVDELGIDSQMRHYMRILNLNYNNGPVGLSNLSMSMFEDAKTIEELYEPYLIKLGFIKRTTRGRMLTQKGIDYIKNTSSQKILS